MSWGRLAKEKIANKMRKLKISHKEQSYQELLDPEEKIQRGRMVGGKNPGKCDIEKAKEKEILHSDKVDVVK